MSAAFLMPLVLASVALNPVDSFAFEELLTEQVAEKSQNRKPDAVDPAIALSKQLQESGVEPTSDGVRKYLKSFLSTEDGDRLTREWVARLGASSYDEREEAIRKLSAMPSVSLEVLKESAASNDPEISWRSRLLLRQSEEIHRTNYSGVLQLIAMKKFRGLSREILFVLDKMDEPSNFRRYAFEAVSASASPADWNILEDAFQDGTPVTRQVVVHGMRAIATESNANRFAEIAGDAGYDDNVKLEAAYGLTDLADRRCLSAFGGLLDSKEVAVRARSNAALMAVTQQNFKYVVYGEPNEIAEKVKVWNDWLEENGATLELHLPLERYLKRRSYLNGNTLIAQGYKNRVLELDADGKTVLWEYETQSPWSAEKLENGNVLIASYRDNKVIEVSPDKKIVWEMEASNVLNVRPLDNGNILMCLYSGNAVQEVNRNKEVVWEFKTGSSVADAIRLPSGNTIIATNEKVAEVDPQGKEVWSRDESDQAYGVNLTPEGTLLISQLGGKVIEWDHETDKIVWEFNTSNPVDAFRLDNGNTLITTGTESLEINKKGETVWQYPNANYGTTRR